MQYYAIQCGFDSMLDPHVCVFGSYQEVDNPAVKLLVVPGVKWSLPIVGGIGDQSLATTPPNHMLAMARKYRHLVFSLFLLVVYIV